MTCIDDTSRGDNEGSSIVTGHTKSYLPSDGVS